MLRTWSYCQFPTIYHLHSTRNGFEMNEDNTGSEKCFKEHGREAIGPAAGGPLMCSGARGHSGALQCLPASCGNFACLQRAVLPGCKPHLALGRTQAASHEDDSTCFLLSKPPACVHQRWPSQGEKCRDSNLPIPIHPHPKLQSGVWH